MVRGFLSAMGKEIRGMHQAAYLLAAFALLSQLLALVRDRLLAATFGAGHALDIYYAAFKVPDFLFATVASLLSLYALLPIISRFQHNSEERTVSLINHMFVYFFAAMIVVCGLAALFAPQIVLIVAPGVAAGDPAPLILMARILLLQPILLGASNILANLTQLRHRFVLYSISPLLYNLGIILGVVWLYPMMGLAGLGWGVVLGALMHAAIQLPYFAREPRGAKVSWAESWSALKEVLKLSVPRTLSLAANQISLTVLTALASFLAAGSITIFTFAWNLQAVPLTIIGVSYSVAAFPTLARAFAEGGRSKEFVNHVEVALRHIIFWTLPATVFIIVLRAQLVRAILGSGAFSWNDTRLTAAALALFILSLLAQSVSLLIARAYYAAGESKKPFYWGVIDVAVSVVTAVVLVSAFHTSTFWRYFLESILRVSDVPGTTVLMLALAMALGSIAEFVVGFWYTKRDFGMELKGIWRLSFQSFAASVIGAFCSYATLSATGSTFNVNTSVGIVAQGALAGVIGLIVTVLVLALLKNEELFEAYRALRAKLSPQPVVLETTDVQS